MNENIDLTKILKDCPKGWKFYTTIWGDAEFVSIDEKLDYPIRIKARGETRVLMRNGRWSAAINAECIIFPSKDQRDWSKFTAPWLEKQDYSLRVNDRAWLYFVSDVLTWKNGIGQYLDDPRVQELAKRLCSKYAQKLYNPSVEKLVEVPDKFDPETLQPFDKILVRDSDEYQWKCTFYSHQREKSGLCKYVTTGASYEYCIPYNDETKHLVGTTDEAPEYYRYWED